MSPKSPAFPVVIPDSPVELNPPKVDMGMDLRIYIATACLQGMLATSGGYRPVEQWASEAVLYADALIAELNKS